MKKNTFKVCLFAVFSLFYIFQKKVKKFGNVDYQAQKITELSQFAQKSMFFFKKYKLSTDEYNKN